MSFYLQAKLAVSKNITHENYKNQIYIPDNEKINTHGNKKTINRRFVLELV